jgi:cytosine/adenosine deaminase-related metal-dependent hydrolase
VDVITPNTGVIHGIGVLATDVGRVATSGASLIWSPRSNVALYGDTGPISEYYNQGVQVALGTDWLQSGSMSLGRELKCADGLDQGYFNGVLPDRYLWKMVTSNPARVDHVESQIGEIAPGKLADLAIFRAPSAPGASVYRAVIDSNPQDVVLTVRGGKVLYGDTDVVTALSADACDAIPGDVCGTPKSACLSETGKTLSALTSANSSAYGLFFCGTPDNEPTCTPARSSTWVKKGSTA